MTATLLSSSTRVTEPSWFALDLEQRPLFHVYIDVRDHSRLWRAIAVDNLTITHGEDESQQTHHLSFRDQARAYRTLEVPSWNTQISLAGFSANQGIFIRSPLARLEMTLALAGQGRSWSGTVHFELKRSQETRLGCYPFDYAAGW